MTSLVDEVRGIAAELAEVVGPDDAALVRAAQRRLDEPLRVAIAGRVKTGKSTLLNAIVGQALAATDAAECTRCVVWYQDGPDYRAELVDRAGGRREVHLGIHEDRASIDLDGHPLEDVERLVVSYPSQHLRGVTLIDTPGVASISEQVSARAGEFLAPPSGDSGADVVVYLLRHLHRSDSDFLEAFTDGSAAADPVRSVGVLARADELGAGRGDAMVLAGEVAARYAREGVVARRVASVLPVSGLLAFTAATLRQDEYRSLGELAATPVADTDRLGVSVDRFVADSERCPVPGATRAALLDRLGVFGVRCCLAAFRAGRIASVDDLEAELREVSGIQPLQALLLERFAARADVLRAARALDVVRRVATRNDVPEQLLRRLGRIEANAHELEELRCLRLLQLGGTKLDEARRGLVAAALGGDGPAAHQRLRLPEVPDAADGAAAARDAVAALRRHRAIPQRTAEAARVLDAAITSLERVHAELTLASER